ncbi:MAG: glycosyltransferase [Thermoanaerobaculia bacterium]
MSAPFSARLALVARLLRAEGPRALVERWRDRRLDARRARRFALLAAPDGTPPPPAGARSATLWVLPFPLQRRRGGAAIQLLVRLEERATLEPVALLQRLPDRFRCELWGAGVERPAAREWPAGIAAEALADFTFEPVLLAAARWVGATRLHFESLVDLPLALPLEILRRGLPFGCSAHDFALFCPRPHLVEVPRNRFCEFSIEPERCARCLAEEWTLPASFQEERRATAARLVGAADQVEFPSEYMRCEHLRLFPALDPARARIVVPRSLEPEAHGAATTRRAVRRPPRRIAFAGAVHPHKGAHDFEAVVRSLSAAGRSDFDWHVFGGGDAECLRRLRRLPRTRVHGYYRAGSLPARLVEARIDLVLLLSIWPEAHCLVLDECAAAGIPVVAYELGAPGERIRANGWGELVDPRAGVAGVAAVIAGIGERID